MSEEDAMNIFPKKHVVYLMAFCAILAIAAFCAETSFPEKTSAASAGDSIAPSATEEVEETVTLSASEIKNWNHHYAWYEKHFYCDGISFHVPISWDEIAGSMVVGYEHYWHEGAKLFGCPMAATYVSRGTVWFDLSSIASKAPPLHVSVTKALLHYKMDKGCDEHQLMVAQENWREGYPDNKLVPGDIIAEIPASCASEGKVECAPNDVARVLNNWLRGEGNAGYANYGFVFGASTEEDGLVPGGHWLDNDSCYTRFSDFSLTVTYKYDKPPSIPYVPPPTEAPVILLDTRKNVALASNGGIATASSTTPASDGAGNYEPSSAINGERLAVGTTAAYSNNTFWRDGTADMWPDWLQVDFGASRTISKIDVYTLPDNYLKPVDPSESTPFTVNGITDFEVQYWTGSTWATIPGGSVAGNDKVWRKFTFPSITTGRIRVLVNKALNGRSRIVELEAWGR